MLSEMQSAPRAAVPVIAPLASASQPPRVGSGAASFALPAMNEPLKAQYFGVIRAVTLKVACATHLKGVRVGDVKTFGWCPGEPPTAYQAMEDDANGGNAAMMRILAAERDPERARGGVSVCMP